MSISKALKNRHDKAANEPKHGRPAECATSESAGNVASRWSTNHRDRARHDRCLDRAGSTMQKSTSRSPRTCLVRSHLRALQSGVTNSGKPLLEVDQEAIQAAWPWAKPGSQPTAENAAKALSNVAKCSALVGFGPQEFGERLKAMAGINRGIEQGRN